MTMPTDDIDNHSDPPTTWPPPVYTVVDEFGTLENSSGQHGSVPYAVARLPWCWGGFAFPMFWAFANRCPGFGTAAIAIALLEVYFIDKPGTYDFVHGPGPLVLIADFVLRLTLGLSGNARAWRNRHFAGGVPQFFAVQRRWTFATMGLVVGLPIGYCIVEGLSIAWFAFHVIRHP